MTAAVEPRFLTLKQAARVTGVSPDTLSRAIHAGRLRAKRSTSRVVDGRSVPSGKTLVRVTDLDAWFDGLEDA